MYTCTRTKLCFDSITNNNVYYKYIFIVTITISKIYYNLPFLKGKYFLNIR